MSYAALVYLAAFVCSLCLCWILTRLVIRIAPHLRLIDLPGERKIHSVPTATGGGLAIFGAIAVTSGLLADNAPAGHLWAWFLTVGFIIVVLGILDDLFGLPWWARLVVQTACVLAMFGWPMHSGWLHTLLALLWGVGLINAFNMLDNMDALSASVARIAAITFIVAWLIRRADRDFLNTMRPDILLYLMLIGALSGFLWFNRPPARIFMGDAGSTFIGFFLGIRSLYDFVSPAAPGSWAVPLCVLAVPWYDLISVTLLRLRQGRSPFRADKQHLSHRLIKLGLSSPAAVRLIQLLAVANGLAALVLYFTPAGATSLALLELAAWWTFIASLEHFARR